MEGYREVKYPHEKSGPRKLPIKQRTFMDTLPRRPRRRVGISTVPEKNNVPNRFAPLFRDLGIQRKNKISNCAARIEDL